MRDPNRIPRIIKKLQKVWEENPDWRLGQLIVNLSPPDKLKIFECDHPYYIEDDKLEASLNKLQKFPDLNLPKGIMSKAEGVKDCVKWLEKQIKIHNKERYSMCYSAEDYLYHDGYKAALLNTKISLEK